VTSEGVNFSVFSRHATSVTLVLFEKANQRPVTEITLDPDVNRTGDIWHIHLPGVDSSLRYGYRADGPFDPEGEGHWFQREKILFDPYARALGGRELWGQGQKEKSDAGKDAPVQPRCCVLSDDFDWDGDRPLKVPLKDSIIYELHVRGYTVDESSGVTSRGTYKGLIEKIPYIKSLGVTAVELMPVFEFNELEDKRANPRTGQGLRNFWGYSTEAFFAPKASYASNSWGGNQVKEFKETIKTFHRAGLEVIIDVVFNHTAETDSHGPVINFRGLDNTIYYVLDSDSKDYVDLSGCGNTVNCNHPVVSKFVLDCLRYWVVDMHVDGFRFDLATILRRDQKGELLWEHSLVDAIEQDPLLRHTKIIAEAWDTGINQVGHFPGRWAEWNSHYRDDVRRFVRGDKGMAQALATRIAGSSDLYQTGGRSPSSSINYITCHDGFTLYDLVSYKEKHNEENGEDNQDGTEQNFSSNCGVEGHTNDRAVNDLRLRRMKSFVTILMVSQGVPMVLAGDEFAKTQGGNNNPYCQDNEISWVNWNLAEENAGLLRFFKKIIALRHRHPVFRRSSFLSGKSTNNDGYPDIGWHGLKVGKPDWSEESRTLAVVLNGTSCDDGRADSDFLVMVNGDTVKHDFEIPGPRAGSTWYRIVDTSKPSPGDVLDDDNGESTVSILISRKS
jgi:glycogen operon protein